MRGRVKPSDGRPIDAARTTVVCIVIAERLRSTCRKEEAVTRRLLESVDLSSVPCPPALCATLSPPRRRPTPARGAGGCFLPSRWLQAGVVPGHRQRFACDLL